MSEGKIGILTLHSGFNEGAILQAFCLATNLQESFSGYKIEIVDHHYICKTKVYGPVKDEKTRVLNDFIGHSLSLSPRRFDAHGQGETFDFIKKRYCALVTGSDEVWKLKYSRKFLGLLSEQSDPWHPAFPNVYWADESIKIPKIAYAASVGQTNWNQIPMKHRRKMRSILSDYLLLGIRDSRTMSFLEWIDPKIVEKAEWVPDPSFSIDILSRVDRESLKVRLEQYGVDFSRPRVCTVLRDMRKTTGTIGKMKEKGFQIVGLTVPNQLADVKLFDKGFTPLEWVAVFGFMDFCILQRMHACISSILNNTPFVAVDFYNNSLDSDTKLKDLMRSFNLMDYYFNGSEGTADEFESICNNMINTQWPFGEVKDRLTQFRNRSNEFTEKIKGTLDDVIK